MLINIGGREFAGDVVTRLSDSAWDGRESKAVTAKMSYQEAIELFENGAAWSVTTDVTDDMGAVRKVRTDMSEYAISGPVTDNRDGTVTVRMGRYRREELMMISLAQVPAGHAEAAVLRGIIEKAAQHISDDGEALAAAALYPDWAALAAKKAEAGEGFRFRHGGGLYRVIAAHCFSGEWIPGEGTESLYERIDETHSGEADDPVPYGGNAALEEGMYYEQDGAVYRCIRDTVYPVHNALSELVGIYVEAVGV